MPGTHRHTLQASGKPLISPRSARPRTETHGSGESCLPRPFYPAPARAGYTAATRPFVQPLQGFSPTGNEVTGCTCRRGLWQLKPSNLLSWIRLPRYCRVTVSVATGGAPSPRIILLYAARRALLARLACRAFCLLSRLRHATPVYCWVPDAESASVSCTPLTGKRSRLDVTQCKTVSRSLFFPRRRDGCAYCHPVPVRFVRFVMSVLAAIRTVLTNYGCLS